MVQKIFINKPAIYPLPTNLAHKTAENNGKKYVLIDTYRKSRCASAAKAIGLSILTVFIVPVIVKKFRASLVLNWRATTKENCLIEKYMLAKKSTTKNSTTSSSTLSAIKSQPSQPKPKIASAPKIKSKKAPQITEKDMTRIVYVGINASTKMTVNELEKNRKEILEWLKDRSRQETDFGITDINQAVVDRSTFNHDTYGLQATLRYMLIKGDIVQYYVTRGQNFHVALNPKGITKSNLAAAYTKDIILAIDQDLQKFKRPVMPGGYDTYRVKLWNDALDDIEKEIYNRHFRNPAENRAVTIESSAGKTLIYRNVFDDLVKTGTIAEWNAANPRQRAVVKINSHDVHDDRLSYVFPNWQK